MISHLSVKTRQQGLHEFTYDVQKAIRESEVSQGLCTLFVKHTSCSLTIQENADPSARNDLENWLNRLVPENDSLYTHTMEGPDDMPSHIKAILTNTTLSIPIYEGGLVLGTWQGIYLWEHRHHSSNRHIVVHIQAD
jgi:secondary thiamine-phosphate synthase enzyme